MPPTVEDRLLDILEAIADVDEILLGKTFETIHRKCCAWPERASFGNSLRSVA